MGYLKTTMSVLFLHDEEYEQDIGVGYRYLPGSKQTMTSPEEPPSIEIVAIDIIDGKKRIPADWLRALVESDETLLDRCMKDHRDVEEDAAERAGEERRERLREEG